MDTMAAYQMALAAKARGAKHRVFDWDKAAQLIKERGATDASAGLAEDWEYTGGTILKDGQPAQDAFSTLYLASNWATPALILDEFFECWRYSEEVPGWNEETFWPPSARGILGIKL